MKRFTLLFLLIGIILGTANTVRAQYCTTGLYATGCTDDDYINSFSTTGGLTNITNNNTACSNATTDAYTFFNTQTHTAVQGTVVNFSYTNNTTTVTWSEGYKIWIDYNENGSFEDAGELVYSPTTTTPAGATVTGNFTVPFTVAPGNKRLRIRCVFNTTTFTSCSNHTFGEVEDYNFVVVGATPCAGPPTAGTANAVPTTACLGEPINLSVTGTSITTSGLTFQWQVSTDNVNWNDITGATTLSTAATQSVTSYYRFRAVCTNTLDTSYTAAVQVISPPIPSGNYTINQSLPTNWPAVTVNANFNNFNDAYDAVKCGIAGAVVFNVVSGTGPYNEQLIINGPVGGASATNTITFNGNGNTIAFASTNTNERAVIKLKGTRHFIFDSLTVDATAGTYGFGFHLINDADSNVIRKCTINSSVTSTSTNFAGIAISGADGNAIGTGNTLCDDNKIDSNIINGGYYGITLVATFSGGANGRNLITNNDVKDFYQYGLYVNGSYNTLISKNKFHRPARTTVGEFNGIYFTGQSNTALISKNRIQNPFGGALTSTANFFGINFNNASASSTNDNLVYNNLVSNVDGNGTVVGFANTGSGNMQYFHNTISLDNIASTASGTTRGIQLTGSTPSILLLNNIITITRGGTGQKHGLYLGGDLPILTDFNDYFINAAGGTNFVGFYTGNRSTLADLQTATGQEGSSLAVNPVYSSPPAEYAPVNAAIDNKGLYVGVDDDILDSPRTAPDIGAYEFTPPPCSIPPVLGTAVVSPLATCQNTPLYLNLNIGAFGSGQTFQWQASPTLSGPYAPVSGNMLTPDTIITTTTTLYYRCAVSCASATEYSDTVLVTVNPAFPAGTYTIDKTNPSGTTYVPGVAGGNFASFNDAKNAMAACGIFGGPVVFNVLAGTGPYVEQLIVDSIKGVTSINTVTFNGNGNTISFNSVNSNERAVIKLKGADHFIFDSLTIDASGGTYGYGVQLISNADSNTFRKCNILTSSAIASTNYAGVVINAADAGLISVGNTLCDGNTFNSDTIIGGYYGVTLVGSSTALMNGNRFTNNYISEFYSHGFYSGGTTNTLIEHNTFTRPARTVLPVLNYGIQFVSATTIRARVSKNRFVKFFGGAPASAFTFYGIHFNSVSATTGNENIVSNNVFYDIDHNGPIYALYNSGSDGAFYYHNTIALDNAASTSTSVTAGFYQVGTAVGVQFKNNIITIRRGGTGQKHAVFLATAGSEVELNHNNYYINAPGVNNFIGYNGVNRLTLADWQAATSQDANSLNLIPLYTDPVNGDFAPNFLPLDDKGVPGLNILTDILDAGRDPSTPDIGAFEFTPMPCTAPPVAGTASVSPSSGICLEAPIHLTLTGNSPIGTITFQWESSSDGLTGWTPLSGILYSPDYDTVTTTNNFYRCAVTCNGVTVYSTVTQVTLNSILLAGTYTIDKNNATTWPGPPGSNFNSFGEAVSALLCGITGPVTFEVVAETYNEQIRIPYIPNTSPVNTVTFRSQNGNASSAILTYNAASAATNYTLKLDSTEYFIFKDLTISATNTSFGRAVEIAGTATTDSILNCIITAPVVTTTTNTVAGIFANGLKGGNIVLRGNTISNGSSGIYFAGTSAGTGLTPGNIIDSNTINGAYYYGIYAGFNKTIQLNGNTINVTGPAFSTAYGLYATDCDSSYEITGNNVNIANTATTINGIYINNCDTAIGIWGRLTGNKVTAMTGNTGILYGMYITNSPGINVRNNVIAINTTGASSYGLYNNNSDWGNYWNNTVNSTATSSTNNYAAYFINTAANNLSIRNNIFSHKGGGRAIFATNTSQIYASDYNMLYTTGATLAQRATPAGLFANLKAWQTASYWDVNSIGYTPAFISNSDLQPDLANPDVWAIHGRGVQIAANTFDFNNNSRPTTLITGVPDLGAYEFYPTALPTVLLATPASPVPGITQAFSYGTDTVMRLKWTGTSAPPSIEVRRYSGVVPAGLPASMDSMYFYTEVDIPGGGNYDYDAQLVYIDPWQGSIPDQHQIGLGKTTPSNAWVVGFNSANDITTKTISQSGLTFLDKFTGLVNPYAPPVIPDKDSSNRGRRFWVAYGHHQGFSSNGQDMKLYLSAQEPAFVQVKINGTSWQRNYLIPANTAIATDIIPKAGADDARLLDEGLYNKGISIVSDVPIEAYAHIYQGANSGASMLMPVGVYGYEYITLNSRQFYASDCFSWFYVVADNDNTVVEITPVVATKGGRPAGVPFTVTLNKGEVYQVMGTTSGSTGTDMTGSKVRSIPNPSGVCYPIAVFSGSSRTAICNTTNGDNIMQQVFPYSAWGKKYASFASANSTSNTLYNSNIWRVMVKDPTTVVSLNGTPLPLASLVTPGNYYEFSTTQGNGTNGSVYIEADKPVLVGQYMVSTSGTQCPGVTASGNGDPELIYISPIEQGINKAVFYNTNQSAITSNYINVVIPDAGMTSLTIDGLSTFTDVFPHPFLPGYTCVRHNLGAAAGQHVIQSDSAFTGFTYGLGSVESYGYNSGTLVRTLQASGAISNTLSTTGGTTEFTCAGSPFEFKVYIPLQPTTLTWKLSQVPNLSPNADVVLTNPAPTGTSVNNGIVYYEFTTPAVYTFSTPGIYPVQVEFEHPDVESCDNKEISIIYVQVLPAPKTNFDIVFSGCVGDIAQLNADALTENGLNITDWQWTFHDATTVTGQNATYTYNTAGTFTETLRTITPDGCIGDSTKEVVVNPRPVVNITPDSLAICSGTDATFTIQNPDADVVYSWYTTPTGGTAIATGTSFTPANITTDTAFYAEGVSNTGGCASLTRKKVIITVLTGGGTPPTVIVSASGPDFVTFSWTAVPGVTYEASVDGGAFVPVSGPGATHTVSGLSVLQSVSVVVKAIGGCGESSSAPVSGCSNSPASVVADSIAVCSGANATFDIQSPGTGITYTWYNALTGGTSLGTGSSFTFNNVTSTASYYIEQQSAAGCVGTPRIRVVVDVLPPLTQIIAVVDSVGTNLIRFAWNAVPGAVSYEVSTDGGATFIAPSSGPTGLSHTVTGLAPLQEVTLMVRAIGAITCQTSTSLAVSATTLPDDIFIPNTFTPNSDGVNDEFRVYGAIIQEMNMMVFNQWGEKVFQSRNLSIGWDGRHRGKPQPSGVYIFVAQFVLRDGTVIKRQGALNLIR